ncbi:hypothetical protein WLH_03193 [Escherichia coli O25b:H4]|uniref:Uncharacterized protein n=1 Tax=Escherichia coli O25b:H4 TaxID=941280 RepID=A0A192CG00_ECO25|nr:hypothetical protein WLH_03193 [Escherichia coli O25b:H4]
MVFCYKPFLDGGKLSQFWTFAAPSAKKNNSHSLHTQQANVNGT